MFYFIGLILGFVVITLAYFYLRFPLEERSGFAYYTNGLFVYERESREGGWIGLGNMFPDVAPFLRDKIVWGASPFSFKFVGKFYYSLNPTGGSTADHIYRDKRHVIYQGEVVWDGDVQSLELFDGYAKDKNVVYLRGYVLRLDPATFELLGCGFWRDKNGVYNEFFGFNRPIPEIDKETFEVRNPQECHPEVPYTAKDKNHLYKSDGLSGFRIIGDA